MLSSLSVRLESRLSFSNILQGLFCPCYNCSLSLPFVQISDGCLSFNSDPEKRISSFSVFVEQSVRGLLLISVHWFSALIFFFSSSIKFILCDGKSVCRRRFLG